MDLDRNIWWWREERKLDVMSLLEKNVEVISLLERIDKIVKKR